MKQELLEYLVRSCAREVLKQINENNGEFRGAAAPPADGQGTADAPALPKEDEIKLKETMKALKKLVKEELNKR